MSLTTTPLDLAALIKLCHEFVSRTTSYLSTLPHPIEPLEELISVIGVTASLLSTLQCSIDKYPNLHFSPHLSFLNALSSDIIYALSQLNTRIEDAKRSKVFLPNDVGLVRIPRNAWVLIMGGEAKAGNLRSRLYVEKYRVRVLIDAVNWFALRSLENRERGEEREYREVRNRLPLVAERLVGVWRDYGPRLKALEKAQNPFVGQDEKEVERQREAQVRMMQQMRAQQMQAVNQLQPPRYEEAQKAPVVAQQAQPSSQDNGNEKQALKQTTSCNSCSSSELVTHETYLLRQNPSTTVLQSSTFTRLSILPFLSFTTKKHAHTPTSHYIKPLPSTQSQISTYISLSPPIAKVHKLVLGMPNDAQWEIQKLVEGKEGVSGGEWDVVGLVERSRRKISKEGEKKKWCNWRVGKKGKKEQKEWVVVLRGKKAQGTEERGVWGKGTDPWSIQKDDNKKAEEELRRRQIMEIQRQQQQQQQASVLRHVEQKRTMGIEEAEVRMDEMVKDLFVFDDNEDSDDEEDDEEDEEEEEELDEKMEPVDSS